MIVLLHLAKLAFLLLLLCLGLYWLRWKILKFINFKWLIVSAAAPILRLICQYLYPAIFWLGLSSVTWENSWSEFRIRAILEFVMIFLVLLQDQKLFFCLIHITLNVFLPNTFVQEVLWFCMLILLFLLLVFVKCWFHQPVPWTVLSLSH